MPQTQTQTPESSPAHKPDRFIDVQSHFLPSFYVDALHKAGMQRIDDWEIPQWSVESAIAAMDELNVDTQVLSFSSPGTTFLKGKEASDLARTANEFAASIIRDHSPRFGAMVTLPMPDVEASLREISYGLDTLKLDGVAFLSNYSGAYLGDPRFDPIFHELHRRKAVVFVHPVAPPNFAPLGVGISPPILEFPFDTTRMVMNLIRSGTVERCPDMKLLLPHGGGTIPYLLPRMLFVLGAERARLFSSFYYDLTASGTPGQLAALTKMAPTDHLMMGFDFPFMKPAGQGPFLSGLDHSGFTPEQRQGIVRDNALRLFPQVASRLQAASSKASGAPA